MKFISVIPARSGSKGVKNKNIFPLNKKPLITYTFNAVKKSMIKNNFILTDDKKVMFFDVTTSEALGELDLCQELWDFGDPQSLEFDYAKKRMFLGFNDRIKMIEYSSE